jgi:hypothetical protein
VLARTIDGAAYQWCVRARTLLKAIGLTLLVIVSFANPGAGSPAGFGSVSGDARTTEVAMPIADTAIGSDQLDASTSEAYKDSAGSVVRLSSEEDLPFVFLGKVPGPGHPKYRTYRKPIARFPDVRSCLIKKERAKAKPDLTAFDWRSMGGATEAEVCIYRIATSYRDPDGFEAWLAAQDFGSIRQREGSVLINKTKEIYVQGYWPVKEKGVLLGLRNYLYRIYLKYDADSLLISVRYRDGFGVYETHISYQTK